MAAVSTHRQRVCAWNARRQRTHDDRPKEESIRFGQRNHLEPWGRKSPSIASLIESDDSIEPEEKRGYGMMDTVAPEGALTMTNVHCKLLVLIMCPISCLICRIKHLLRYSMLITVYVSIYLIATSKGSLRPRANLKLPPQRLRYLSRSFKGGIMINSGCARPF